MEHKLSTVKLSHIENAINSMKAHFKDEPERIPDIEISFEYIIASFFPDVWDNIQRALKDEHTKGYIEGLNEQAQNLK